MSGIFKKIIFMFFSVFSSSPSFSGELGISGVFFDLYVKSHLDTGEYVFFETPYTADYPAGYGGLLSIKGVDSILLQAVACPTHKHTCGRKGRVSSQASGEAGKKEKDKPKSSYDICEELMLEPDEEESTFNNKEWLLSAFNTLHHDLFKESRDNVRGVRGIPQNFLRTLASAYHTELSEVDPIISNVDPILPQISAYAKNHEESSFTDVLTLIRLIHLKVREGDSSNSAREQSLDTKFTYPEHSLKGGRYKFVVNSLYFGTGSMEVLLRESLNLFCLTLHPELATYLTSDESQTGLLNLFLAMGILTKTDSGEHFAVNTDLASTEPKDLHVSHIGTKRLIEELTRYYSSERPVPLLLTQLANIQQPVIARARKKTGTSATPKPSVEQRLPEQSTTLSSIPMPSPDTSDKALPKEDPKKKKQPRTSRPSIPQQELLALTATHTQEEDSIERKIQKQFQAAIENGDIDQALALYKKQRPIIEGSKNWLKRQKELFVMLLTLFKAREVEGLIRKYGLM